jgi:hypothetical protein
MRVLTLASLLAFISLNQASEAPQVIPFRPPVPSGPPQFAFNGRDLAGFYPFTKYHKQSDPNGVFSIQDGMIRVSGLEYGGLATTDSYANYHLIVEWKWGSNTFWPRRYRARNSGVLVHGIGPDGAAFGTWMASIECQILEGGTGDLLVLPTPSMSPGLTSEVRTGRDGQFYRDPKGEPKTLRAGRFNWWGRDPDWRDVLWFRGPRDVERPVGDWNRTEVICERNSIIVLLNGVVVNSGTVDGWSSGKIQLQSEGAEIFVRKFEVRPLSQ